MNSILSVIEIFAILAFAYTGIIEARRSGFDFVGVLTIANVSAFGGGILRDVMLNRHPLYWIENWTFLIYIFFLSAVVLILLRHNKDFSSRNLLTVVDALGLGLFCAAGVGIALEMNTPVLPAVLMGVITSTFGSVLRDILCNQKAKLFQPSEPIYATCALIGAWFYALLHHFNFSHILTLVVCIFVTFLLRVLAVRFNFRLSF